MLTAAFAPEPFVSAGEAEAGLQELADLDQGSTQDFPIQGYAVTADWAKKYPNTLKAFTTALSQGQQIADTDRAATEAAIEKYLGIPKQSAAFISLPAFPLGVDPVRLQRVVSAMTRFGLLPKGTSFKVASMLERLAPASTAACTAHGHSTGHRHVPHVTARGRTAVARLHDAGRTAADAPCSNPGRVRHDRLNPGVISLGATAPGSKTADSPKRNRPLSWVGDTGIEPVTSSV